MNDLVVISAYDSGVGFSVMVNGTIYYKAEMVDGVWEEDTLADEVRRHYYSYCDREKPFKDWLREKFGNTNIILCEDGNIQILQTKRQGSNDTNFDTNS